MKNFQSQAPGSAAVVDTQEPAPAKNRALLRVALAGTRGTDLPTSRGANALVALPRVPGHEAAAVIFGFRGATVCTW